MHSTLRRLVLVMATATTGAAGCAHGWNASDGHQDARGSLRLAAGDARLLVAGPATRVHTSVAGGRPVALFIADAVNGDDGDCALAAAPAPVTAIAIESTRRLQVPEGQVLCAVSASSTRPRAHTELLWHAHREPIANSLALR